MLFEVGFDNDTTFIILGFQVPKTWDRDVVEGVDWSRGIEELVEQEKNEGGGLGHVMRRAPPLCR